MSEPRNPDINYKPIAKAWLEKHPEARNHFEPLKNLLLQFYSNSNHGYINQGPFEYRFDDLKVGVIIFVSQAHSRLRIKINCVDAHPDFRDYCKRVHKQNREYDAVTLFVSSQSHLIQVADFFRKHQIPNFPFDESAINLDAWEKNQNYTTTRTYTGQEIKVTINHKLLSDQFVEWLRSYSSGKIHEEYRIEGCQDRIDVIFNFNGETIISELKTVEGSSSKRAIREALGQVLDYQYYQGKEKADQLWIVLNDEADVDDIAFINVLIKKHKIPLRLVCQNSKGFSFYPALQD